MTGRSLPHAILMMIPEPWQDHESDEPGAQGVLRVPLVADGAVGRPGVDRVHRRHGDRRGARPQRAAAVALLRDEGRPRHHGVGGRRPRHPAREHRASRSGCTRAASSSSTRPRAASSPTRRSSASWRGRIRTASGSIGHLIDIEDLPAAPYLPPPDHETVLRRQQVFGYTHEDLRLLLAPMASTGEEPIGSMGTDTSLAVLSDRPRLLYDYFKQLFAQVTNPPLDAIREELVTSMESTIGPEGEPAGAGPGVVPADQRSSTRSSTTTSWRSCGTSTRAGFRSITLPMLFRPAEGGAGLERALEALKRAGERRGRRRLHDPDPVGPRRRPRARADSEPAGDGRRAPSSRARGHAHALRAGRRIGRRARSAPLALLLGYGAGAVNPYLAFETLDDMIRQRSLDGVTHEQAVANYIKALNKGILKVMSKMGISTLQSYCGAQIFEAVGLDAAFVDRYFTRTASRIGGVGLEVIAEEVRHRHERAFPARAGAAPTLDRGGEYQWRRDGEYHLFNPRHRVQAAARDAERPVRHLQGVHRAGRRPEPAGSPRCAACSTSSRPRRRFRSTRSSRSSRSSSASRPARCRTARSARKRTRRSRSR